MKRTLVHSAVVLFGAVSIVMAAGQQPQTRQVIDVQKITDN
jgi:hypothetical protein